MNFYLEGSMVGLSIYSWYGVLFFVYLIFEIVSLVTTKMSLIHKLIILPFIVYQIKKMIPRHWKVKGLSLFFFMKRRTFNNFEMYLEFVTNLKLENVKEIYIVNPSITNDFISVNFFGKLLSKKFVENIHKKDLVFSNEIKRFNRNEKLKDLGI